MDKRTKSGIHVVKPVQAVYGSNGQVLATSQGQSQEDDKQPTPVPFPTDGAPLERGVMYIVDDWILKGHRINIVGVYDQNGFLQGGLFIADHDGSPHSLVKPEEEKGVLFHRLCELKDIPTEIGSKT